MTWWQEPLPLPGLPDIVVRTVPTHPAVAVARFAAKIVPTASCHWYTAAIGDDGYGRYTYLDETGRQRTVSAHRFAWEATRPPGELINETHVLMHECNNTLCVYVGPGHVVLGTQLQNVRYADRLGRRRGNRPVAAHPAAITARAHRAQLRSGTIPSFRDESLTGHPALFAL
ncbi:hypothetical protein CLV47_11883 [Antricoccus suffuscus]|uniref:HNH endonuclease n=1 Tax=Antricoccus suffuscus TaxID=1629062 RepID=A0A2T0ZTN3_9ACTN|nr:hypothetical protein [Antricoccus suffuscus]PRZ39719.1 hypothetical protein CLV47_11883 [Antricoccus suffuscus]